MKTITAEELKEVIERHGKWLRGEDGGENIPVAATIACACKWCESS